MSEILDKSGFNHAGYVIRFNDQDPEDDKIRYFTITHLRTVFLQKACITYQEGADFKKWLDWKKSVRK